MCIVHTYDYVYLTILKTENNAFSKEKILKIRNLSPRLLFLIQYFLNLVKYTLKIDISLEIMLKNSFWLCHKNLISNLDFDWPCFILFYQRYSNRAYGRYFKQNRSFWTWLIIPQHVFFVFLHLFFYF